MHWTAIVAFLVTVVGAQLLGVMTIISFWIVIPLALVFAVVYLVLYRISLP